MAEDSGMRVFIGYDPRQPVAYQVCAHSVWKHAVQPVGITRLDLSQLPIRRRGLTEFTYSRFLVPYLSDFQRYSVFLDSDILVRADVHGLLEEMLALGTAGGAVAMVQGPRRFEWPSVMVFNNRLCRNLTPAFIEDPRNGMFDMRWAPSIGALDSTWNHLVGYDAPDLGAKIVHFTKGIPVWPETERCEFAEEWHGMLSDSLHSVSHEELMGRSVHVAR